MAGTKWTQQQISFLQDNYHEMSCKKMASHINKTTRATQHKFNQLGLKRSVAQVGDRCGRLVISKITIEEYHTQNISKAHCKCDCGSSFICRLTELTKKNKISCGCKWKENLVKSCKDRALIDVNKHDEIIKKFKSGRNCSDLCKDYNVEYYVISKILHDNNIKIDQSLIHRVYDVNDDYFQKINTEEKAYWLGFIYGDGHVLDTHVCLGLKESDKSHIQKFIDSLGYDGPIRQTKKTIEDKTYYGWSVSISSRKMVQNLKQFGVYRRKTFLVRPPKLEEKLERHFWRGLVDADGCLGVYGGQSLFNIVGTKLMLEGFLKFLSKNNISNNMTVHGFPHSKISKIQTSGNLLVPKIVTLLYDKNTISLNRKQKTYLNILNN